jgi:tetratricopeptide (TPR) repeat protein
MGMIENFEKMLADGQDNALLRYSLGNEYFKQGDAAMAAEHLARAVQLDQGYSAAWKLYGKVLSELGRGPQAMAVYEKGIEAAEAKGDKQAAKEMQVFLKRLRKQAGGA